MDAARLRFIILFVISIVIGLVLVALVTVWTGVSLGGFAWTSEFVFNYHPVLMISGPVVLSAITSLLYRAAGFSAASTGRRVVKALHAILQSIAFALSVIGLKAVFDSHNLKAKPIPNLYSLHSWIGLVAIILMAAQLAFGLLAFVLPLLPLSVKSFYLPVHRSCGVAAFLLCIIASISGITEKNIFVGKYSSLPGPAVLSNFIGVLLVVFCLIVLHLGSNDVYRSDVDESQLDEQRPFATISTSNAATAGANDEEK